MFFAVGDILAAQYDPPFIHVKASRDCVEEGGFPCAVAADDGGEIPVCEGQAYVIQRFFFVDGAGVKGFGDR